MLFFQENPGGTLDGISISNQVGSRFRDYSYRNRQAYRPYIPEYHPGAVTRGPNTEDQAENDEVWPYDNPDSRNKDRFILREHNRVAKGPRFPWGIQQPSPPSMGLLPIYNETFTDATGKSKNTFSAIQTP